MLQDSTMRLWALRGANSVDHNDAASIGAAVRALCAALLEKNLLAPADLGKGLKPSKMVPKTQLAYAAHCQKGILIAVDVAQNLG